MKFPLLLDTYGVLLTERKREILDYYYNDDYSLSEISELTGISRQGVRDNIVRAEKELINFENALGLWKRFSRITDNLSEIRDIIQPGICLAEGDYHRVISLIDEVENYM